MRGRTHISACVVWGVGTILLSGCTGLKYATEETPLFVGFEVEMTNDPVQDMGAIQAELEDVITPTPNNSIIGMRPTVALHNMTREPKRPGKGLRNLLKYKIGSKPVYLADVPLNDVDAALVNRLNNRGYFAAEAHHTVIPGKRTAHVVFTVVPGRPHLLRHIAFGDTLRMDDTLMHHLQRAAARTPLKPGMPYKLALLNEERARLVNTLRNNGYYQLHESDLIWAVDTTVGGMQADVLLRPAPHTTADELRRYTIGNVYVHGDHDPLLPPSDTTAIDSLHYVNNLSMYRPRTILRGVFIRPGRPYSQRTTDLTRQYLSSYGVFTSVNVQYLEDSVHPGLLHADVLIGPQKRFSLFTELNAISKSNNFAGPGVKVGFKDRDLFRGAELLTIDLNSRFETQLAGAQKGTNAYEIGAKAALSVPRILLFKFLRSARASVPTTRIELGYGLFRRIGLYGLESANLAYSYVWRSDQRMWHDIRFPDVSYNNLYYTSPEFDLFLGANPTIRRSFDEQFIIGAGYTFTWNTRRMRSSRSWALISIGADEGGGLTSLAFAASGQRPAEGYNLFGERYSQFVRLRPEVRWYRQLGRNGAQLAFRVLASSAWAYGNSSTVPYVKQFFSGGTNSLRAFRARSVGPGTYSPDHDLGTTNLLIDQVGDIKFEANLEYRFPIAGFMKGALFADAGNVWLMNDDPGRPGGKFDRRTALDELAVGAGFGIRFDPEVIVVRLDLATPLRRPDLPQGDRWTFNDQYPRLTDNFILNIAIGYPF
jgi:outer membrane protein assembly factor BamA